jgi:hypothetical protein
MTNTLISRKFILGAAAAVFGGLALASVQAHAGATSDLLRCNATTKDRVVHCCEQVFRTEKKPVWFLETGSSCQSVAVCVKKQQQIGISYVATPRKCYIRIPHDDNNGNSDNPLRPIRQLPTNLSYN